ncbi:hypothetical protein [Haloactinopolyspora sp.]|uniref:hypothetical protein n=1 Tax=Haloactinopolyspora sp. TaxID=1966353 RepID=UPI00260EE61D|nr:hypothetical protein [Haloactinopolyspora sp.]
MGLPDHEVDDVGDGVDPGVWRDLVAAVDGGSWLVVPDEGVPVVMVADGRGRRYPTVAGVTPAPTWPTRWSASPPLRRRL